MGSVDLSSLTCFATIGPVMKISETKTVNDSRQIDLPTNLVEPTPHSLSSHANKAVTQKTPEQKRKFVYE